MVYDVIIIGAGAAGLFAAANLPSDRKVMILERNDRPGIKLLMTGASQCNITNIENIKTFIKRYNNPAVARKVLYNFNNIMLMEYFEGLGLKLIVREDGKVFPASLKSKDVLDVLIREIQKKNHQLNCNESAADIKWQESIGLFSVVTDKQKYTAKKVMVATGGQSYPKSGSDGSFIGILTKVGVKTNNFEPALTSVKVAQYRFKDLSGTSLSGVRLSTKRDIRTVIKTTGDLLFTHDSFSGPVILNSSRNINNHDKMIFDFIPQCDEKSLFDGITRQVSNNPRKEIKTTIEESVPIPKRMTEVLLEITAIDKKKKSSEVSKKDIQRFIRNCKHYEVTVMSRQGFENAMVSSGGISNEEINFDNMTWLKNKNLIFIGEVIDIDGETGGYNLQFAFSSAKKAVSGLLFD
ncbi:MAG: aminoacetone oxidase family FAD-binding enzyme [Eubacteriales bacterium]|nr:aminoacetone oxidase family FAD-binding enzyme [Eubacteriales bacterium]